MHHTFTRILILGWLSPAVTLWAQDAAAAPALPQPGPQLRAVSGYTGYYSSFLPNGAGFQTGASNLPADFGFGGSAVFDWTHFSERSSFALTYTPSYTGSARFSSTDALNHGLSLSASRKVAPRWTWGFAMAGSLNNIEQSLYAPTALSSAAAVPSNFADLAAGLLQSKFTTNPELGSVLTGAPLIESPLNSLFYGVRMFTASVQTSLAYSYSPRLSISFSAGSSRAQHLKDSQAAPTQNTFLIPNTTSGTASLMVSYSLSPVTQIGGSVTSSRTLSPLFDAYTTTSLATLGRTFSGRWIVQMHAGVGVTNPLRQTAFITPGKPYPSVGGGLAYKTGSHTFLGSYDRTVTDAYGVGASTSSSANGTWRWGNPGRRWWMDCTAGWQQMSGNGLSNIGGWHLNTGFNRAVGPHVSVRTEYAYLHYTGGLLAAAYNFSQSAVRVIVSWYPQSDAFR